MAATELPNASDRRCTRVDHGTELEIADACTPWQRSTCRGEKTALLRVGLGPSSAHVVEPQHRLDVGARRAVTLRRSRWLALLVVEVERALVAPAA